MSKVFCGGTPSHLVHDRADPMLGPVDSMMHTTGLFTADHQLPVPDEPPSQMQADSLSSGNRQFDGSSIHPYSSTQQQPDAQQGKPLSSARSGFVPRLRGI